MGLCYRVGELDAGGRKCMAYWRSGPTESIVGIRRQMANDVYRRGFCGEVNHDLVHRGTQGWWRFLGSGRRGRPRLDTTTRICVGHWV